MAHPVNENPFNTVPPVIVAIALAIFGIEVAFQLADRGLLGGAEGIGWRVEALNAFAFSPPLFERDLAVGTWDPRHLSRLVTYAFVHVDFLHAVFAAVFVLALGKMVAETFRVAAVLAIYFGATILGAVVYALLLATPVALIGGMPGAYGMIGAYTFLLWTGLGAMGMNRLRAFQLIGLLMAIQLIFGIFFGGGPYWVAELTGFVVGFLLSFAVSPGGVARLRAKMRSR